MDLPMQIDRVAIDSLNSDPANVRLHDDANLSAIAASLRRFGQQKPIVVDTEGIVRAGNGTLEAAKSLGWTEINAVTTTLDSVEAVAYAIADNRTGELATWDDESLSRQLQSLAQQDVTLFESVGFSEDDLQELLSSVQDPNLVVEDEVPEPPDEAITQPGDLWIIGAHRLL